MSEEEGDTLDVDEIEKLLFEFDGNVSKVAKALHLRSDRVRRFVDLSGQLRRAQEEVKACLVDEAVDVIIKGLRDETSYQNSFYASKVILYSDAARRRGFGAAASAAATLEVKQDSGGGRTIVLKWLEPDPPAPKLIEGEKAG